MTPAPTSPRRQPLPHLPPCHYLLLSLLALMLLLPFMAQSPAGVPIFLTGVCAVLVTGVGAAGVIIMRIRHHTIDAQDKRDMRWLHPDVSFDWKKIACQLAEKREACRQYRSRRRLARRPHIPREPF